MGGEVSTSTADVGFEVVAVAVGGEVVGSFEIHLRSAFFPPIHKPLQQSVDTSHDSSTKASEHDVTGDFDGDFVG